MSAKAILPHNHLPHNNNSLKSANLIVKIYLDHIESSETLASIGDLALIDGLHSTTQFFGQAKIG
jgi:hypothetical protein